MDYVSLFERVVLFAALSAFPYEQKGDRLLPRQARDRPYEQLATICQDRLGTDIRKVEETRAGGFFSLFWPEWGCRSVAAHPYLF